MTAPLEGEPVVVKKVHSAFIVTDLAARLQAMGGRGGVKPPLVICGVLLANSVEAAVRVAGRLWVAEDVHQLTLALLDGEYAEVTTVDAILGA